MKKIIIALLSLLMVTSIACAEDEILIDPTENPIYYSTQSFTPLTVTFEINLDFDTSAPDGMAGIKDTPNHDSVEIIISWPDDDLELVDYECLGNGYYFSECTVNGLDKQEIFSGLVLTWGGGYCYECYDDETYDFIKLEFTLVDTEIESTYVSIIDPGGWGADAWDYECYGYSRMADIDCTWPTIYIDSGPRNDEQPAEGASWSVVKSLY